MCLGPRRAEMYRQINKTCNGYPSCLRFSLLALLKPIAWLLKASLRCMLHDGDRDYLELVRRP